MKIAGIIKSSLIDYPSKASTVIFLGGCNFKCGYCHNPELLEGSEASIEVKDFLNFIEKRKRFIDGVCITGGEPTINKGLPGLIQEIKALGFSVKLDTNGSNPSMLEELIDRNLLDYLAMDIKGPYDKYQDIARSRVDLKSIEASAGILSQANGEGKNLKCEFRTTVCRELLSEADIERMLSEHLNHPPWYLQSFKDPGEILDDGGTYSAYTPEEMEDIGKKFNLKIR